MEPPLLVAGETLLHHFCKLQNPSFSSNNLLLVVPLVVGLHRLLGKDLSTKDLHDLTQISLEVPSLLEKLLLAFEGLADNETAPFSKLYTIQLIFSLSHLDGERISCASSSQKELSILEEEGALECWTFSYSPLRIPASPSPSSKTPLSSSSCTTTGPSGFPSFLQQLKSFLHFSKTNLWILQTKGQLRKFLSLQIVPLNGVSLPSLPQHMGPNPAVRLHHFLPLEWETYLLHASVAFRPKFPQLGPIDPLFSVPSELSTHTIPLAPISPSSNFEPVPTHHLVPGLSTISPTHSLRSKGESNSVHVKIKTIGSFNMAPPSRLDPCASPEPPRKGGPALGSSPPIMIPIPRPPSLRQTSLTITSPTDSIPRHVLFRQSSLTSPSSSSSLPRPRLLSASTPSRPLLGSYEDSLLHGFVSHSSKGSVQGFTVKIAACGGGATTKHLTVPITADYYHLSGDGCISPYVAAIDLDQVLAESKHKGMLQVPVKGLIQVVISNPERTGIKLFVVSYDLADMPPKTRTFMRQTTTSRRKISQKMTTSSSSSSTSDLHSSDSSSRSRTSSFSSTSHRDEGLSSAQLCYALQLRFLCSKHSKYYLHKKINVVFSPQNPDKEDIVETKILWPQHPKYSPLSKLHAPPPASHSLTADPHLQSGSRQTDERTSTSVLGQGLAQLGLDHC